MLIKLLLTALMMCTAFCTAAADDEIILDKGNYQVAIWESDWQNFVSEYAAFETPEALLEYAANAIDGIVEITGHENWMDVYSQPKVILDSTTEGTQIAGGYYSNRKPMPIVYLNSGDMQHGVAALTHELTHIVCQNYSSLFLREGLAQYLNWMIGGQEDMILFELNPHFVCQNIIRKSEANKEYLYEIGRFSEQKLRQWIKKGKSASFYIASYSFAKYLIETYGMESYMAVYGAKSEEAYTAVIGKPLEEIQTDWLACCDAFEGMYDREMYLDDISERLVHHGADETAARKMAEAILNQLE